MTGDNCEVKYILFLYQTDQFKDRLELLCSPHCQCEFFRANVIQGRQGILKKVEEFYGKLGWGKWILARLGQLRRRILRKPTLGKLGDEDRAIVFEGEVFPPRGDSRFDLLSAIEKSLRDYYLLIVLAVHDVSKDRRLAFENGARIVLNALEFTWNEFDDYVLAARRAETAGRRAWVRGRIAQSVLASLVYALGAVATLAVILAGSAISGVADDWTPVLLDNRDQQWRSEILEGQPSENLVQTDMPARWREYLLQISNLGGSPKHGFVIETEPAEIEVRNLPERVPERLKVGESFQIRFYVPARLPDADQALTILVDGPRSRQAKNRQDRHQIEIPEGKRPDHEQTQTTPLPLEKGSDPPNEVDSDHTRPE